MSAQYLLPCSCGQKIRISQSQAGGQANCGCGKSLPIPTLRGIRQLEMASEVKSSARPSWSRMHGAFFATGVLLIALGAAAGVYYLAKYAQIGGLTVDRSADVVRSSSEQIDTLTPIQTLEMWSHEILEEGLGEPQPPYWIAAKAQVAEYFWRIKLASAALILGGILALAALFVGRK